MAKKKTQTTKETYTVRYDKRVGEYWLNNLNEDVNVNTPLDKEKDNHEGARRLFLEKHAGQTIKIVTITYH